MLEMEAGFTQEPQPNQRNLKQCSLKGEPSQKQVHREAWRAALWQESPLALTHSSPFYFIIWASLKDSV